MAYNFFLGLDQLRQPRSEVFALWGREMVGPHQKGWHSLLKSREGSPQELRRKTLLTQIQFLRSTIQPNRRRHGIIAFTPFYAWAALPGQGFDVYRVHSEQSKGGRHHELAAERGRFGIREMIVRTAVGLNIRHADILVFPSHGALDLFKNANSPWKSMVEKKGKVIYNGVSLDSGDHSQNLCSTVLKVVSVADHVPEKGLPVLLSALAEAKVAGVNFKVQQFGNTGPMTAEIRQLASELGLAQQVSFLGRCPHSQVIHAMREADIFLHTPEVAIFDQCVVEAMLCGTLVVSVNLPGIIEAVGEAYPFIASEARQISSILTAIHSDRAYAARAAEKSKLRAQRLFSAKTMTENYLAVVLKS